MYLHAEVIVKVNPQVLQTVDVVAKQFWIVMSNLSRVYIPANITASIFSGAIWSPFFVSQSIISSMATSLLSYSLVLVHTVTTMPMSSPEPITVISSGRLG